MFCCLDWIDLCGLFESKSPTPKRPSHQLQNDNSVISTSQSSIMSFFTNPFATVPSTNAPVFASSPLNPLPSPSISSLRRTSLVRPAAADNNSPPNSVQSAQQTTSTSSGISFISPFATKRAQSPVRSSPPRRASLVTITSPATPPSNPNSPKVSSPQLRRASIGVPTASSPTPTITPSSSNGRAPIAQPQMTPTAVVFSMAAEEGGAAGPKVTSRFLNQHNVELRRRSVDVGVLGLGTHRMGGAGAASRRVRDAIGPDAGDKEFGLTGSAPNGKDRM